MFNTIRSRLFKAAPTSLQFLYSSLTCDSDRRAAWRFFQNQKIPLSRFQRAQLIRRFYRISYRVCCRHTQEEMLSYATAILECAPDVPGGFVEAGTYKGGSTAKFSLAARLAGRTLFVFDSFEGIPDNNEAHERNIFGGRAKFKAGSYRGGIDEVRETLRQYGDPESCRLIKGWFEETMPHFNEPIAGAYLDVDLVSSTRTCLKYLYPRLALGGVVFSQDGHLPLVVELFDDDHFWESEIGCPKPVIDGLRSRKLLRIVKTQSTAHEREMGRPSHEREWTQMTTGRNERAAA